MYAWLELKKQKLQYKIVIRASVKQGSLMKLCNNL